MIIFVSYYKVKRVKHALNHYIIILNQHTYSPT